MPKRFYRTYKRRRFFRRRRAIYRRRGFRRFRRAIRTFRKRRVFRKRARWTNTLRLFPDRINIKVKLFYYTNWVYIGVLTAGCNWYLSNQLGNLHNPINIVVSGVLSNRDNDYQGLAWAEGVYQRYLVNAVKSTYIITKDNADTTAAAGNLEPWTIAGTTVWESTEFQPTTNTATRTEQGMRWGDIPTTTQEASLRDLTSRITLYSTGKRTLGRSPASVDDCWGVINPGAAWTNPIYNWGHQYIRVQAKNPTANAQEYRGLLKVYGTAYVTLAKRIRVAADNTL